MIEGYTSGLENFLAVLDAQRSLYAADDALVESERDLALSLIAVYKSLGGGWQADGAVPVVATTLEELP